VISAGINRLRPATAQMLFWVFSALMVFAVVDLLVYTTPRSCGFLYHRGHLRALSLYGYTTKRDMTGMGSFLIMACSASSSRAWSIFSPARSAVRVSVVACWCLRPHRWIPSG